jgi:hypothetical protein
MMKTGFAPGRDCNPINIPGFEAFEVVTAPAQMIASYGQADKTLITRWCPHCLGSKM